MSEYTVLFQYLHRFQLSHYFPQFIRRGLTFEYISSTPCSRIVNSVHLSAANDKDKIVGLISCVQEEQGGVVSSDRVFHSVSSNSPPERQPQPSASEPSSDEDDDEDDEVVVISEDSDDSEEEEEGEVLYEEVIIDESESSPIDEERERGLGVGGGGGGFGDEPVVVEEEDMEMGIGMGMGLEVEVVDGAECGGKGIAPGRFDVVIENPGPVVISKASAGASASASASAGAEGPTTGPGASGKSPSSESGAAGPGGGGPTSSGRSRRGRRGSSSRSKTKICVALRKRPLNDAERGRGEQDVIEILDSETVVLHEPKLKVDLTRYVQSSEFLFDVVFDESTSNRTVYEQTTKPLIEHVFQRGVATCFAYGQTGAGKTFTMMGGGEGNPGVYLLASLDLFDKLDSTRFEVWLSFFEIYGGKLYDLLNNKARLVTREDARSKVNIIGLKRHKVQHVKELIQIIEYGNSVRQTGSTGANDESSRSHAVLGVEIRRIGSRKTFGKISFIDLAGSERGADTYFNDKQTRLEGAEINKSLLALKECIRSLDQKHAHVPFRGSKLTEVLKDSFIGNSRTVMIAAISPNSGSCEHTLNTLRYADRVKEMKNSKRSGGKSAYYPQYARGRRPSGRRRKRRVPPVQRLQHRRTEQKKRQSRSRQPPEAPPAAPVVEDEPEVEDDPDLNEEPEDVDLGTEELERQHEELISRILEEEEDVIKSHRQHIDVVMEYVKEEMRLLHDVEQPGSEIDKYVTTLDRILQRKVQTIEKLRQKLSQFQEHLREEEILSRSFKGTTGGSGGGGGE